MTPSARRSTRARTRRSGSGSPRCSVFSNLSAPGGGTSRSRIAAFYGCSSMARAGCAPASNRLLFRADRLRRGRAGRVTDSCTTEPKGGLDAGTDGDGAWSLGQAPDHLLRDPGRDRGGGRGVRGQQGRATRRPSPRSRAVMSRAPPNPCIGPVPKPARRQPAAGDRAGPGRGERARRSTSSSPGSSSTSPTTRTRSAAAATRRKDPPGDGHRLTGTVELRVRTAGR